MDRPLRFATFLAPNMLHVYRHVAEHVGERLGRRTELIEGRSLEQFATGEADVGFL